MNACDEKKSQIDAVIHTFLLEVCFPIHLGEAINTDVVVQHIWLTVGLDL